MAKEFEKKYVEGLFSSVAHLHFKKMMLLLEHLDVGRGQFGVLMQMFRKEGMTQKEIGEKLNVKPATVTKIVKRLEEKGFIERQIDSVDRRVVRIYLTQKAEDLKQELSKIHEELEEICFKDFREEEKILMRRFLEHMKSNLLSSMEKEEKI